MSTIWFIDTSVLCELVRVPGMEQQHDRIAADFRTRVDAGDRFIIPITAVIETGNHICNANGNRRAAAERLSKFLDSVRSDANPWLLNTITWNAEFLERLLAGDSTGQSFVDLAGNAMMGGGDVSILVEAEDFARRTSRRVEVWTLEAVMSSFGTFNG